MTRKQQERERRGYEQILTRLTGRVNELSMQLKASQAEVVRLRQDLACERQLVQACNFWQTEAHRLARVVAARTEPEAFTKLDVNHPPFA